MFKRSNQNGLTLAELLVTTMIIGVIMVGMVSVDYALRTNEQQQSRTSVANLRTAATLQDIVTAATQAYGDVATRCVQMANLPTNSTNYICVYRDYGTPANFADDNWQCYTRHTTNIHKCTRTVAAGKGVCATTDPVIGAVTIDTFNNPDTPVVVSTSPDFYFQITLKNRFDPTRPTPGVGGVDATGAQYSAVIANELRINPKVLLSQRVAPRGCVP